MRARNLLTSLAALLVAGSAQAADSLTLGEVNLDRPTLHTLGIQLLISDDDDRDAMVTVRHRAAGESTWHVDFPLMRVWPETVTVAVPAQFAGSIFDLEPDTSYEVELTATDPDGGGEVVVVTAATRGLPRFSPANPLPVSVANASELSAALAGASPGTVITLADGTYPGSFSMSASGTADDPIVIRGASQSGTVLDGGGCLGCNILEIYGSHVHVERLTLTGATRALRFLGQDATGNVARQLVIEDVVHGIGSTTGQTDFFICDNVLEGRLLWPWTFDADASTHWDDRGVDVTGDGHVVCHNLIRGFGDPIVNKKSQHRSFDVYGNDVFDSFDGTELDDGEGNTRLWGNRYTNVMDPVSIQPIWGGPTYVLRNVVLNAPEEPIKLKSTGGVNEPSGALIFHNTFVSPNLALNLQTPITQHNFRIENNLFVGPATLASSRTVEWTAAIDGGTFDYNGYYPDGGMWFGSVGGTNRIYDSFSDAQAAGEVEANGVLLSTPIFAADFVGPADEMAQQAAQSFALDVGSAAVDAGRVLAGINDGYQGAAPDLGAIELGCPAPHYGPRPEGDEANGSTVSCPTAEGSGGGGAGTGGAGAGGEGAGAETGTGGGAPAAGSPASGDDGSCGCRLVAPRSPTTGVAAWLVLLLLGIRRRRP